MRPSRQIDAKKTALCASGDGTVPMVQRQVVKQVLQTVYGDADDSFWEYRKLAIEQASVAAPDSLSVDTGDLTYDFHISATQLFAAADLISTLKGCGRCSIDSCGQIWRI